MSRLKLRAADIGILFDVDSFCNRPLPPDNVPTVLPAAMKVPRYNVGINGQLAQTSVVFQAGRIAPYTKIGRETIYHLQIGVNDIAFGGVGSAIYANKVLMADAARAAGFTYVVSPTTPPFDTITGGQETQRDNLNAAMLADADNAFDLVIDLTGDSGMENPNGAYYADGVHWSAAGALAYVAIAQPQIEALL